MTSEHKHDHSCGHAIPPVAKPSAKQVEAKEKKQKAPTEFVPLKLEGLDAPALLKLFQAQQAERSQAYAAFDAGLKAYIEHKDSAVFEDVCTEVKFRCAQRELRVSMWLMGVVVCALQVPRNQPKHSGHRCEVARRVGRAD
jgi:hypothetical protein